MGTALLDTYSKCGCLDLAYQLFDKLLKRDTLCCNVMMIGGFSVHDSLRASATLNLYEKMKLEGLVPERVPTMPMKPNAILWIEVFTWGSEGSWKFIWR